MYETYLFNSFTFMVYGLCVCGEAFWFKNMNRKVFFVLFPECPHNEIVGATTGPTMKAQSKEIFKGKMLVCCFLLVCHEGLSEK